MKQQLTNREMVRFLLQHTLSRNDIGAILCCGDTKSSQIINDIQKELIQNGTKTTRGIVSTEAFLSHMKWSMENIIKKAQIEKELGI